MLENCLADNCIRILNGFSFDTDNDQRTVQEILQKFEEYAIGEVNETMESSYSTNSLPGKGKTLRIS